MIYKFGKQNHTHKSIPPIPTLTCSWVKISDLYHVLCFVDTWKVMAKKGCYFYRKNFVEETENLSYDFKKGSLVSFNFI